MALALGGGGVEIDDGTIGQFDIGSIGAIAPVAQSIGEAARDRAPCFARRQGVAIRRGDQRVVGQALEQFAVFQRRCGVDASGA